MDPLEEATRARATSRLQQTNARGQMRAEMAPAPIRDSLRAVAGFATGGSAQSDVAQAEQRLADLGFTYENAPPELRTEALSAAKEGRDLPRQMAEQYLAHQAGGIGAGGLQGGGAQMGAMWMRRPEPFMEQAAKNLQFGKGRQFQKDPATGDRLVRDGVTNIPNPKWEDDHSRWSELATPKNAPVPDLPDRGVGQVNGRQFGREGPSNKWESTVDSEGTTGAKQSWGRLQGGRTKNQQEFDSEMRARAARQQIGESYNTSPANWLNSMVEQGKAYFKQRGK